MSQLDDLLNELTADSSVPPSAKPSTKTTTSKKSGASTSSRKVAPAKSSKSSAVDQDLEDLMKDLTAIESAPKSKDDYDDYDDGGQTGDDLEDLVNSFGANKGDSELEDLMHALSENNNNKPTKSKSKSKGSKSSTSSKKSVSSKVAPKASSKNDRKTNTASVSIDTGADLDDLMRELTAETPAPSNNTKASKPMTYRSVESSKPVASKSIEASDLEDLMNDLASGSVGGNVAGYRSQTTNKSEDLEDLMNDLVGQPVVPSRSTTHKKQVRQDNELDDLMNELSSAPAPAPSRAQPLSKAVPPQSDDLNSLLNDLSLNNGPPASELEDLMNSLETGEYTAPPPQNTRSKAQTQASSELESIMNELNSGRTTSTKPQPKKHTTDNELEALMSDLENAPASYAQTKTSTTKSNPNAAELDDLMAGLSDADGNPRASLRRPVQPAKPPARSTHKQSSSNLSYNKSDGTSDLDDIMAGLNATTNTSNNTYDLDEIVNNLEPQSNAHGSPAKVNPRAAGKRDTVGGSDLDGILNQLNSPNTTMDSATGPAAKPAVAAPNVPKGICSGCRKPIHGSEQVNAMGRTYHKEHFQCSTCGVTIGNGNFFEKEGQPQCENCYQSHFCQKCFHCNMPISSQLLTALGKSWHPTCFICTNCLNPFVDGSFFEKEGRPYCGVCFYDVFAQRCRSCNQPIRGTVINALGSAWHPEHFNCQTCHRAFTNGQFYDIAGLPYCDQHYRQQ